MLIACGLLPERGEEWVIILTPVTCVTQMQAPANAIVNKEIIEACRLMCACMWWSNAS